MSYPQRIYVLPARQTQPHKQHVAPRHAQKRAPPTEQIVAELLGDDFGPTGPRKRERLNHLTQQEKMERRKLKNRVAAQNARDKKKERSSKIEDVMRDLVEENRKLRVENEKLRRENEQLIRNQEKLSANPVYIETNNENESNIYTNVVYEEEVVGEVEDCAFESAAFISTFYQQPPMHGFQQEDVQCRDVDDYCYAPVQPSGADGEDDEHFERILEHLKSPSGEFDRYIAGYLEEEGDYCASSSSGSFLAPSETRETLSPGSLALSPSMSNSSNDWEDETLYCQTASTETDDALVDPGNWNFETFDESSIDLNFFEN
ncbi:unnamed protein product [Caenorhabditis sp. 36 PRJEB53466]|nr:unnamed protein product [Caenorhabditis sp. 36 PRJEB53466]